MPVSFDIDLGDDDSLPAVGRVWDEQEQAGGPSLSELVKQQSPVNDSTPQTPQTPVASVDGDRESNVESLTTVDLKKLWPLLLADVQGQSKGLSALGLAHLDRIEENIAYIRFGANVATFAHKWQNSDKRDVIARVLSSLVGHPVGVMFEVDEDASAPPPPSPAPVAPVEAVSANAPSPPRAIERAAAEPPREATPVVDPRTNLPITPELIEQLREDELTSTILDGLGATVMRVTEG